MSPPRRRLWLPFALAAALLAAVSVGTGFWSDMDERALPTPPTQPPEGDDRSHLEALPATPRHGIPSDDVGRISGILCDEEGRALAGTLHLLFPHASEDNVWWLGAKDDGHVTEGKDDGRFTIPWPHGAPPPPYTEPAATRFGAVLVASTGFVPRILPLADFAPNAPTGRVVTLKKGTLLRIRLMADFPVQTAGQLVQVTWPRVLDRTTHRWVQAAQTGDDGCATFPHALRPGSRVLLDVQIPGAKLQRPHVIVAEGIIDCPLEPTFEMIGTVTHHGEPVAGAALALRPDDALEPIFPGPATSADGSFRWPPKDDYPARFCIGLRTALAAETAWLPAVYAWTQGPLRIDAGAFGTPLRVLVTDASTGLPVEHYGIRIADRTGCGRSPCHLGFHPDGELVLDPAPAGDEILVQAVPVERTHYYSTYVPFSMASGQTTLTIPVPRCRSVTVQLTDVGELTGPFEVSLCTPGRSHRTDTVPLQWYESYVGLDSRSYRGNAWTLDRRTLSPPASTARLRVPADLDSCDVFVRDVETEGIARQRVALAGDDTSVTIAVPRARVLRGKLECATPDRLAWLSGGNIVATRRGDPHDTRWARIGPDGTFVMKGLLDGTWQLGLRSWGGLADPEAFATLTIDGADLDAVFDVTRVVPRRIKVVVTQPDMRVRIAKPGPELIQHEHAGSLFYATGFADVPEGGGEHDVLLPAGRYRLILYRMSSGDVVASQLEPHDRVVADEEGSATWMVAWKTAEREGK